MTLNIYIYCQAPHESTINPNRLPLLQPVAESKAESTNYNMQVKVDPMQIKSAARKRSPDTAALDGGNSKVAQPQTKLNKLREKQEVAKPKFGLSDSDSDSNSD